MQPSLRGIRRLSVILSWSCVVFVVAIPAAIVAYWFVATPDDVAQQAQLSLGSLVALTPWQRVMGALITVVPAALLGVGLLHARACFTQFARGTFFTMTTVSQLRGFAGWVCASVVAHIIARTVLTLVMSFASATQKLQLTVGVGSDQLFALFIAGMVWLIAAVMTHAVTLADEHAQFV
jgi:hypothetical protein